MVRVARVLERGEVKSGDAARLRKQLAAANALESDFESLVETVRNATEGHAKRCELVTTNPEAALTELRSTDRHTKLARSFAVMAAYSKAGREPEARREAQRFLRRAKVGRWAAGARPVVAMRRRIGQVTAVRFALLEHVPY